MAVDVEKLQLLLEVQGQKFENQLKRQNAQAYRIFKQLEDRASQMEKSVGGALGGLAKRMNVAFAGLAAGLSLNELRKTADDYTKIINSLKVAGVKDGDLQGTFDKLFASAQKNAAPLDALSTLYGRVSAAQATLKASSAEVMQVTDIVAQSLRVGGTSATEASGALLQLGQALAGGKIQAEEFNSLTDGMRPLLEAAAAGLKEAGGDVATLTTLVKSGKVSSEAFFRAIIAGSPILEQKLAGAATTTEQAMQRMKNELTKAVGEFDRAVGVTPALAAGLDRVAGSIGGIGKAATDATVATQGLVTKLMEAVSANMSFQRSKALSYQDERAQRTDQAREMGMANAGGRQAVNNERSSKPAQDIAAHVENDINSAFDIAGRQVSAPQPVARPKGLGGPKINPVSLADFTMPGDKDGKRGGGGSGKESLDSFERALVASEKRREALRLEAEMEGKSTFEKAKAREALELLSAAKRAGIPITEEMKRKIDEAATGYANAKVRVEDVTKAIEASQDAQRLFATEITDAFSDIIVDGEKAEDVVKNLAKALAKAALQAALMGGGPLAGLFGTSGSNGSVGGLFGMASSLFGGIPGRAAGGPVSAGKPYIVGEKRPELFVPNASGRIVPKVPSGVNGGNSTTLAYRDNRQINITPANGVTPAQMTAALAVYDKQMRRNITSTLHAAGARY